jgi:type I restriction enzyme, S subunit
LNTLFRCVRLGDPRIAKLTLGQSPPSSAYNSAEEGLPFFQGKSDFGMIHPIPRIWCREGVKRAAADDILISVRAPVGDVNIADQPCIIGRGVAAVTPISPEDASFLFFALMYSKATLTSRATGSTFASVNGATLADLEIPYPAARERLTIGATLMLVMNRRAMESQLLAFAEALKRSAMHTLFTRGLRGEAQKQTEIGPLPESWDVVALGTLGRVGNGSTPKKSDARFWAGGSFPWLTSAKVYDREISEPSALVTETALRECHLPIVEPGAVLIAITGQGKTLGHCGVLRVRATVNQHIAYVATDVERVDPSFLRGYIETQYDFLRQVGSGGGSTKGALTCGFLRELPIPLPQTLDEQREIASILNTIDQKVDLHRRKRAALDELFRSLLHKLMTGEIHVADLDLSALGTRATPEQAGEA